MRFGISKSAQSGEMISPISAGGGFTRTDICTIVDMNSLEVEVGLNESCINRVHRSRSVNIKSNAFVATDQHVLPEMGVRVAFF